MTTAVTATPEMPRRAIRLQGQLLLFCGAAGMRLISSKSISAFHLSRIPGKCPAPTTATTFDALSCAKVSLFNATPCKIHQAHERLVSLHQD